MNQADPKIDRLLRSAAQGKRGRFSGRAVRIRYASCRALARGKAGKFQRPGAIASPRRVHGRERHRDFFRGCAL